MTTNQQITEIFKRETEEQGFTYTDLANLLGITVVTVSDRMRGKTNWTWEDLERYGRILGLKVGVVFHRTTKPEHLTHPKVSGVKKVEYAKWPPSHIARKEEIEQAIAATVGGD